MARKKIVNQLVNVRFPYEIDGQTLEHGCAWNDHGMPCGKYGHLSQTTLGAGPWYCSEHFGLLMGWKPQTSGAKPISIAAEEIAKGLKEPYRSKALAIQKQT